MKKLMSFLLSLVMAICLFSGFAFADEPPENGWYIDTTLGYRNLTNGEWYKYTYYYRDGEKVGGWQQIDGKWYYFSSLDLKYADDQGNMYRYDSKGEYFLGADGAMITNAWREEYEMVFHPNKLGDNSHTWESYDPRHWEYYGADGKRTYGWAWIDGKLYYFDDKGLLQTGWFEDDSGKYYLTEYGAKTAQWLKDEETSEWSYFKPTGALAKDEWVQVKTKWYLFDENGIMLTGEQERDGKSYLLSDSGAMYTGWKQLDDGQWIYYKADGAMAKNEWVMVKNQWYLFDAEGLMRTGFLERYDHTYYFDDNGAMATGWKKLNDAWYYFRPTASANGPEGSMVKDAWVLSGDKWYYIGDDGVMLTGWQEFYSGGYGKSYEYYFNESGAMLTGWKHVDGNWYFFRLGSNGNGPEGSKATGWVPAEDKWYYTDPANDGAMVLGWQDIGGKTYYFDEGTFYGQMVTGKQTIDGKEYTFDENGALVK